MNEETEIGGGQRSFQPTLWTEVLKAKDPAHPERRQALEKLIDAYWKPVYFFLRRRGHDVETSKDLAQGFFATLLARDFVQTVDRDRGKFRTYLLAALEHFLADEHDRAAAQKRGGGAPVLSLDFVQAETEVSRQPAAPPDKTFQRQWALQVIQRALTALRAEYEGSGRREEFEALRLHLNAQAAPSYAEVAKMLGLSESDVRNRLHRVRTRYREAVLAEIRSYSENEEAAEEELRELFAAFS